MNWAGYESARRSEWRELVVRYAKEHKQVTRQRIIERAGHR